MNLFVVFRLSLRKIFQGVPKMNNIDLTEYVDKLYQAALSKTRDSYIAEEVVQETFIAAIKQLSRGKEPDNLWSYLYRIMCNKFSDYLREKYNKPRISLDDYPYDIPDDEEIDDESTEQLEMIRREIGYLGRMHREVIVRFYMHGESIEKIARELGIPQGTVKSRLNTGRQQIKEGVSSMENYTKQSYEPDMLFISCSGETGINDEPFSLVPYEDKLTQNVLLLAYDKPVTVTEIAKALGVPAPFIEPIVEKMTDSELMRKTDGGKVYTDFIIFNTDRDGKSNLSEQLETADKNFAKFWDVISEALAELMEKDYYKRQTEHAKHKLEMHFVIKLLINSNCSIRDEITGSMPYEEYPYRKDGGRWIAMGNRYPADYKFDEDSELFKYGISGESGYETKNFRDAKYLMLRVYSTDLGKIPYKCYDVEHLKWIYEILSKTTPEESVTREHILESANDFVEMGILKRENGLELDIPILTKDEYDDEAKLQSTYVGKLSENTREAVLPLYRKGYTKLPPHLKSVPKWQQYMNCGNSVQMAVIYKAKESGLFLKNVDYPVPAAILVIDK